MGTTAPATALALETETEALMAIGVAMTITAGLSTREAVRKSVAVLDWAPWLTVLDRAPWRTALDRGPLNGTALKRRTLRIALPDRTKAFSVCNASVPTLATAPLRTVAVATAALAAKVTNEVHVLGLHPRAVAVCPAAITFPEIFDARIMGFAAIRFERVT